MTNDLLESYYDFQNIWKQKQQVINEGFAQQYKERQVSAQQELENRKKQVEEVMKPSILQICNNDKDFITCIDALIAGQEQKKSVEDIRIGLNVRYSDSVKLQQKLTRTDVDISTDAYERAAKKAYEIVRDEYENIIANIWIDILKENGAITAINGSWIAINGVDMTDANVVEQPAAANSTGTVA